MKFSIYLLLILFQSGIASVDQSTKLTLDKLFPDLTHNWNQYVVYFKNGENKKYSFQPNNLILNRVMVVNGSINLNDGGTYKYSNTFNVIIGPILYSSRSSYADVVSETIHTFKDAVIPSRSIFIFFQILHQLMDTSMLPVFPALKVVLHLPFYLESFLDEISVSFICRGYCKMPPVPIRNSFLLQRYSKSLVDIHSSPFKNSNGKVIPSLAEDIFGYTLTPYLGLENQGVCLALVKRLQGHCRTDIMTFLTVGQTLNATMFLYRVANIGLALHQADRVSTYIDHVVFAASPGLSNYPRSLMSQLLFNKFGSTCLQYCDKNGHDRFHVGYMVWYEPLSSDIWKYIVAVFISIWIVLLLDPKVKNAVTATPMFIISALGQGNWHPRRYLVIASGLTYLYFMYENSLLSIITVVSPPKVLETLRELLDAGFKIIWLVKLAPGIQPFTYYDIEFQINKLLPRVNDSFFMLENVTQMHEIVETMETSKQKLAMTNEISLADYILKDARNELLSKWPSVQCFTLKQTLNRRAFFWKVNTENSYWIQKILMKIVESGLSIQWDEWSNWSAAKRFRVPSAAPATGLQPDYIVLDKILAVMVAWSVLLLMSVIMFCWEITGLRKCSRCKINMFR